MQRHTVTQTGSMKNSCVNELHSVTVFTGVMMNEMKTTGHRIIICKLSDVQSKVVMLIVFYIQIQRFIYHCMPGAVLWQ